MPSCDAQAAPKVALELQGDVCIRGLGEHAAVVAGMGSFGPAPIARNGSIAWFQPDLSMRRQWYSRLAASLSCGTVESRQVRQLFPSSSSRSKWHPERSSGAPVWRRRAYRGKDFPSAFSLPTLLKVSANGLYGLAILSLIHISEPTRPY